MRLSGQFVGFSQDPSAEKMYHLTDSKKLRTYE